MKIKMNHIKKKKSFLKNKRNTEQTHSLFVRKFFESIMYYLYIGMW